MNDTYKEGWHASLQSVIVPVSNDTLQLFGYDIVVEVLCVLTGFKPSSTQTTSVSAAEVEGKL